MTAIINYLLGLECGLHCYLSYVGGDLGSARARTGLSCAATKRLSLQNPSSVTWFYYPTRNIYIYN